MTDDPRHPDRPAAAALAADDDTTPLPTGWRVPLSLLVLAAPIIASMVSRTAMSFVDFLMVSTLGTEAQAAIMPAGILLFCVISFGMGALSAVSTFVSQALGRRTPHECGAYAWQGMHLSAVIAALSLAFYPFVPAFFEWVGHAPNVQAMEVSYVRIGLLGMFPALASLALSNFANGIHKPMVGFWSMLAANLFNLVANYALIFGHWGFPAMGIAGAAWATQLAGLLQAVIILAWMLTPSLARTFNTRRAWPFDPARFAALLRIGTPAGIQFTIDISAFTIFTLLLVGQFGTIQLAAHNLTFKCLEVSFMPVIGLGTALTAMVGKAIGHGRPDHARLVTRWAAGFSMAYMGLIGLTYVLAGPTLARLLTFDDADAPAVVALASQLLLLCAVFQMFDALGITHISALRGAGDNHWPAVVGGTMAFTLLVGGGYLIAWLWPQGGAVGPWIAATVFISTVGLTMWARWHFGPWERISLFPHPTPAPATAAA